MKSLFGFIIVNIAFLLCFSDTIYASECSGVNIPERLMQRCPKLIKGNGLGTYVTTAVVDVSLNVLTECENHVDSFCRSLPKVLHKYVAGGQQVCKDDLKTELCDRINEGVPATYCSYYNTVKEILKNPNKWVQGKESDLCQLFEPNPTLCSVVKGRLCKRIDNVLVKTYCHRIMREKVC